MKRIGFYAGFQLLPIAIAYSLGAFIKADFDVSQWGEVTRFAVAFGWFCLAYGTAAACYLSDEGVTK